jgi:hypothetical protein
MTVQRFCCECGDEAEAIGHAMICAGCAFLLGLLAKYQWGLKS